MLIFFHCGHSIKLKIPGFSLFEMLITLAILSILFAIFIPSHKNFLCRTTEELESTNLLHAIQLARSTALFRGERIILCKSDDQVSCGGQWRHGFIITTANQEVLYSVHHVLGGQLFWRAFPKGRVDLEFWPSGFADAENGTFWYCERNATHPAWAIFVNISGRARRVIANAKDEILDDLTCQS